MQDRSTAVPTHDEIRASYMTSLQQLNADAAELLYYHPWLTQEVLGDQQQAFNLMFGLMQMDNCDADLINLILAQHPQLYQYFFNLDPTPYKAILLKYCLQLPRDLLINTVLHPDGFVMQYINSKSAEEILKIIEGMKNYKEQAHLILCRLNKAIVSFCMIKLHNQLSDEAINCIYIYVDPLTQLKKLFLQQLKAGNFEYCNELYRSDEFVRQAITRPINEEEFSIVTFYCFQLERTVFFDLMEKGGVYDKFVKRLSHKDLVNLLIIASIVTDENKVKFILKKINHITVLIEITNYVATAQHTAFFLPLVKARMNKLKNGFLLFDLNKPDGSQSLSLAAKGSDMRSNASAQRR